MRPLLVQITRDPPIPIELGRFEQVKENYILEFQYGRARGRVYVIMAFSLCSDPEVDPVFLDLVLRFLEAFPSQVELHHSPAHGKHTYEPGEVGMFLERAEEEIQAMRIIWRKMFPNFEWGAVRGGDACHHVGFLK